MTNYHKIMKILAYHSAKTSKAEKCYRLELTPQKKKE